MPCLVILLALISPRLAIFCIWIFSDILSRAFDSWIAGARMYMAAPGLRAIWKLTAAQYCVEYRGFVEKNIINRPAAAPADAFAAWRALVGEELGRQK
mgnify:CR=1 FL=1